MSDNRGVLDRCANSLRIHEALNVLLPEGEGVIRQAEWLRLPSRAFNGSPPLTIMRGGFEGLTMVHRYLESGVQH